MRRPVSVGRLQRFGWYAIFAGAIVAAFGTVLRDRGSADNGPTYLFDTLGFLLAVGGAVLIARVGAIFLEFAPASARRGAIFQAVTGIVAALAGCVALGTIEAEGSGKWLRPLVAAALVGGVGAGLAGLFTLAWFYGLDWAASRMERLDRSEVEERRHRPGQDR